MKLSVTFLLILMILPSLNGEKSSKRTLRGASLRGIVRRCSGLGEECTQSDCCGDLCCSAGTCVMTILPCTRG
uniref:Conotoxin n=1 Tax=Conus praecellens TaxID=128530 RepID=A0A291C2B9_CONPC|nr:conotoxin [Conus praecellens]